MKVNETFGSGGMVRKEQEAYTAHMVGVIAVSWFVVGFIIGAVGMKLWLW